MSSNRKQIKYGRNKKKNNQKEKIPFWKKMLKVVIGIYLLLFLYSTVLAICINIYEKDVNRYLDDEDYKRAVATSKKIVSYDKIKKTMFGYHSNKDLENFIRHEYLYALSNKELGNLIEVKNITESILEEKHVSKNKDNKNKKAKKKYKLEELKNKKYLFYLQDIAVDNYIKLGYFDKAVDSAKKYINEKNTENADSDEKKLIESCMSNKLIILYSKLGEYDRIVKMFLNNADSNMFEQQTMLGLYYFYNQDYDYAINIYNKYIKDRVADENLDFVKLSLAKAYALNGEYTRAKNTLLNIESNSSKITINKNYLLAYVFTKMRNKNNASLYYKILLDSLDFNQYKASPSEICTKYYYAILEGNTGMKNEAEKLFSTLNMSEDSYFKNDIGLFCNQSMM